jgi:hypothetical protein
MSNLPKIDYPVYKINVPSLKKDYQFRPFLVKEEKILLMAKESDSPADVLIAVKQIINNCSLDRKLDVNKLTIYDLEFVFLKLRSFSIDNTVKVSYKDNEDSKVYEFVVELDKVKIVYPEKMDPNIKITNKSGIVMKHPSASLYEDKEFLSVEKEQLFELIVRCIDSIYYEDQVYPAINYKREELTEFLENLNIKTFEEIQKFLVNVPKMEYKIQYKNELGNDREIVLNSLSDFFTLR